MLEEFKKGQFARFRANPNYWGGKPAVDKVVLRKFNNPDAMVAALKTGELDAAEDIPSSGFHELEEDPNIVTVEGNQGAMGEIAINGGDGLKKPHPALADPKVREAIGHAIDRETIVDRALEGLGHAAADAEHLARPEVDARPRRRHAAELRPRPGERDPRRGRLQGHRRRRHPRDARTAASRSTSATWCARTA